MDTQRVKADWERIAKEPVRVEEIKGTLYGYGTELACLRLAYEYRRSGQRAKAGFSENLKTWFFRLEMKWGNQE